MERSTEGAGRGGRITLRGRRNLYFLWRYNVQKQCLWVSSPGSFGHTFGTEVQGVVVGGLGLATPETSAPHERNGLALRRCYSWECLPAGFEATTQSLGMVRHYLTVHSG